MSGEPPAPERGAPASAHGAAGHAEPSRAVQRSEGSALPARAPLDRSALERVLARAAELQSLEGDAGDGTLNEEQLIEIGKEVGISPQNVQQALAEERTRLVLPEDTGFAGRIAGPALATAYRTVRGTPADVLGMLDTVMQREECLQVKRQFPDRMTWEARRDFFGRLRRDFNVGGRGYHLSRAHEVAATAIPLPDGRVFVRLDADLAPSRAARIRAGGAAAVGGVGAGAGWLVIASSFLPPDVVSFLIGGAAIAAVPALVGVGVARQVTRAHARNVARAQLALEQALDRLERGELPKPPSLWNALAGGLLK